MTDSYAWFQSSASSQINFGRWAPSQKSEIINVSNLGLRFFLLNSLGQAVLGAPKPLCFASLKQLRHLDSYELAQVAKQDPVAKVRTLKTVWAILIYNSWMFVVYHQQIAPMYLKWAFKSQQKYLESQKQMI